MLSLIWLDLGIYVNHVIEHISFYSHWVIQSIPHITPISTNWGVIPCVLPNLMIPLFTISYKPSFTATGDVDSNVYPWISNVAPATLLFTDTTPVGTNLTWAWDFGDGGTSTLQNPTHVYTAPGPYIITLSTTGNALLNGGSTSTPVDLIITLGSAIFWTNFISTFETDY